MINQFCTSCGHSAAMDAEFCENCGVSFGSAGTTVENSYVGKSTSETARRKELIHQARLVVGTWVMPFNATLVFGSTLFAVFDFLSPRVALLPIGATVAVVGLLTAVALRKFVAPNLPEASAFRRALAPEMGLHRSPMLIATGLLSALMVTGAAWSNAESNSGGVIASKFDAARNAQIQLGVLQGVQKEQRVQTAVLEDIREGRSLNPRRELANQGILWTHQAFRNAISIDDPTVVSLFLAGGMKWDQYDAYWALKNDTEKIASQLIQRTELFQRDDFRMNSDCGDSMSWFDKASKETKDLPEPQQHAYQLTSVNKKFLRFFCTKIEDLETARLRLHRAKSAYDERHQAHIKKEPEPTVPLSQCRQQLLGDGGRKLFDEASKFNISAPGGRLTYNDRDMMLNVVYIQLFTGDHGLTSKVTEAVAKYCATLAVPKQKPKMDFSDRQIQSAQQIVNVLN